MNTPENLKYTKDHEWALLEDGNITVGITDFAQNSLGDIVFVELPEVGTELDSNQAFGVVESIKSVSDLYSPIAGVVVERNESLEDAPEMINSNPYDSWFIKLKPKNETEYQELMSSEDYQKRCQEEI